MILKQGTTLHKVKRSQSEKVYYSAHTAWWTDDPADLQSRPGVSIPLDIFGSPLLEADKDKWIKTAESKPEHYGEHGLEIFMATHHKNFTPEVTDSREAFKILTIFQDAMTKAKAEDPNFTLLKK